MSTCGQSALSHKKFTYYMLVLCSILLPSYYAHNYASLIGSSPVYSYTYVCVHVRSVYVCCISVQQHNIAVQYRRIDAD